MNCKILLGVASVLCLVGCVKEEDILALQARIEAQDAQIRQLSQIRPAQADTWAQVQQIRQEMASMQGELDNFHHSVKSIGGLEGLLARVNRHQDALQMVASEFALDFNVANPQASSVAGSAVQTSASVALSEKQEVKETQQVGSATVRSLSEVAHVAPAPVVAEKPEKKANTSTAQASTAKKNEKKSVSDKKATVQQVSKTEPTPSKTAQLLYDTGIKQFYARKYQESKNAFDDFIKTYSSSTLIGNAYFWRAENYFSLGQYSAAVLDYEKVISKYTGNPKSASAYLKQGICFVRLNNKQAAKVRLNGLIKKFPKSPEAKRAGNILKSL